MKEPERAPTRPVAAPEPAEPKRNRQHARSQMSTSRLLAAAADLFAERGYRQTSLADIGKKAGYSHGLVTRRFGSKQGLLIALLDYMVDDWMQDSMLSTVGDRTGIDGIRAFFDAFCANATEHGMTLRALESLMFEGLRGEAELKERLALVQKNGQEYFKALIQGGTKPGSSRRSDFDTDAIALMASTALRGATYRWLLEDDFDLCATLTAFGNVLESIISPRRQR